MTGQHRVLAQTAQLILHLRHAIVAAAILVTLALAAGIPSVSLVVDFDKSIPAHHPYTDVLGRFGAEFGNQDEILLALEIKQGDIYSTEYMQRLEALTDAVFFLPGVDRSRVTSLFTPNVRYTEVVADGFVGGPVLPDGFSASAPMLEQLRHNVAKSQQARLLVSHDGRASLVRAALSPLDPGTGAALDYLRVAEQLQQQIQQRFSDGKTQLHIVGFAPFIGAISSALREVSYFLLITLCAVVLILYAAFRSPHAALFPLASSLVAITWLMGCMGWLGMGINPTGVLVPFLVIAIGVSHGVQVVNAWLQAEPAKLGSPAAAQAALCRLLLPGALSLASDCLGFATILFIDIPLVRELGLTATAGMAVLLVCNLILLPCLLAMLPPPRSAAHSRHSPLAGVDTRMGMGSFSASAKGRAAAVVIAAALLTLIATPLATRVSVGDVQGGAPELHHDSTYNQSLRRVGGLFSAGIDTLVVYGEVGPNGCMNFAAMQALDDVAAALRPLPQVLAVRSVTDAAKTNNSGWHEGLFKWKALPRDGIALGEVIAPVQTSSGLLNHDCSVLPVYVDTIDHAANTIRAVVQHIDTLTATIPDKTLRLHLAGGNLAVRAATNEVVTSAQFPVLATIYGVVFLMCVAGFRSWLAGFSIILPLAMVSVFCYALMHALNIGLTPYTLPVVAVGAGIGVDYSLYLFHQYRCALQVHTSPRRALATALGQGVKVIAVTGFTLSAGVLPWIFSGLKYQADMGLLLAFLFVVNMLAAIVVMPALVLLLSRTERRHVSAPAPSRRAEQ